MGPGSGGNLVGRKLGDYQLQSLLGAGGMAEVYRALELPLGREVAVKVLPAALAADPNYVTRFRTEARRVAQLRHPNIVEVYAFNGGEHGDLLYLVMPVLSESLRDRLDDEGSLSIRESVRIVTEIASGLDIAHAVDLVHRDVKPENILLDKDGRALLTDFGIAREVPFHRQGNAAQTLAATGLPVGTPEYMAPEQLRGGAVDQRADIYALGSVLYELLTGRVPHEADTPYEVAALVLTEPTVPPSRRNGDISPELEQVVMKALAKIPTQRYPDMRSFALALNAAVRSGRTTMRTLAGGWQRKTVRFSTSHSGANGMMAACDDRVLRGGRPPSFSGICFAVSLDADIGGVCDSPGKFVRRWDADGTQWRIVIWRRISRKPLGALRDTDSPRSRDSHGNTHADRDANARAHGDSAANGNHAAAYLADVLAHRRWFWCRSGLVPALGR